MADFYQSGMVATLQWLKDDKSAEAIENKLRLIGRQKRIVLLLPALYSEFEGSAMPGIIEELKGVGYLHSIVLSLEQASEEQYNKVRRRMGDLPQEVKIVWNDGPRLQKIYRELRQNDFEVNIPGKGRTVWMGLGFILAGLDADAIALHDCDILNYRRSLLARLIYPVVHPALDFEFSKGYYVRVTDKLYGRVTRLFYGPLIWTLKRILGHTLFIEYLDSFRYALSGEFALVSSLAKSIRISPSWGLEISMLSEIYQKTNVNRICQVEIAEFYEHKHRVIKKARSSEGLIRMAGDIAGTLFRVLAQDGIVMSQGFFKTLIASYIQEARRTIEKYNALALFNSLQYDRHEEIYAVEAFVNALKKAAEEFNQDPVGSPLMAGWTRVNAAIHDLSDRLCEAVEKDNA